MFSINVRSAPPSNRYGSSPPSYNNNAHQTSRISSYETSSHQENYNRAARGWGQAKDFYRPLTFGQQQPIDLPYTDF